MTGVPIEGAPQVETADALVLAAYGGEERHVSDRPPPRRVRWLAAAVLLAVGGVLGARLGTDRGDAVGDPGDAVRTPSVVSAQEDRRPDTDGRDGPDHPPSGGDGTGSGDASPDDGEDRAGGDDEHERDEPAAPQPVGDPQRILIPAIGVDAEIVPAGLKDDGAMDVPDFGLAGWYTEGPRPGEEGPSTVVAHVDSKAGPDVFYRLGELEPGDEVRIRGEDGTVRFLVEGSERAPKDKLPEERIWGWTEEPTLRLITCDGLFDRSTGHYEDNLILYLSLDRG